MHPASIFPEFAGESVNAFSLVPSKYPLRVITGNNKSKMRADFIFQVILVFTVNFWDPADTGD